MSDLYRSDFYAWTQRQSWLLNKQEWHLLDTANLIEEIESLGNQERKELVNRLEVLLGHLLKWQYQPGNRSNSWFATIKEQRRKIKKLLDQNPSLKPYFPEAVNEAYEGGIDLAVKETNLPYETFPQERHYTLEQVLDEDFWS